MPTNILVLRAFTPVLEPQLSCSPTSPRFQSHKTRNICHPKSTNPHAHLPSDILANFEMTERTKKSAYNYYTKPTPQTHHSEHNATHQAYSNPTNQPSGTPSSLNPPKNFSSDKFIPVSRSWGQPCTNPSTSTATQQTHKSYTTTSTWLSDPQREQPWNAIGSVPARPFGPGAAENVAKEKKEKKKDSARATRGSAFSAR